MVRRAGRRYPATVTDVSRLRVSDAERNAVVDRLHHATTEGRLDLEEFDERLADALAARTRADLELLLDDLPAPDPTDDVPPPPAPPAAQIGALLAPAVSALGVPFIFDSALGWSLGITGALIGTLALFAPGELPPLHRWAALIGIGLGLMPIVFVILVLTLGA